MKKVFDLNVDNRRKIQQIISSSNTMTQKKREMSFSIKAGYIRDYCVNEGKKVTFTNGVVVSVAFLQVHIVKKEFIDIALDDLVFHRDEENPTILDLLDYCLSRELIKENENMYHYKRKDLNKMLNNNITGSALWLEDKNYLLDSAPTAITLRNWCFTEGLIKNIDTSRPPIKRRMQTYVFLHAMGEGYNDTNDINNDDVGGSYFEFLKKQNYPDTLREYFHMNDTVNDDGLNLIAIYNADISNSYNWVVKNILNIERYPYGHSRFSSTLHYYILKIHYPDILKDIKYNAKNDDPKKLVYAIEMLGI